MSFPKKLKQLRLMHKMTQEELGSKINVTKVSVSGYENGNRTPDMETLQKIADVFGVSIDYLLGRSVSEHDNSIDPEWQELFEQVKQKGAELEATALLRSASKLSKNQMRDILRVLEMIEKDED